MDVQVLVVGAGLGTNAGLGLEVPLAHGKFLTDGQGGVREVPAVVRAERARRPGFPGFMGESFRYLKEGPEGYLGNAGFIYGCLLGARLGVDVLQHPVTQADKQAVGSGHEDTLEAEAQALRRVSPSYAASIAALINGGRYQVILGASKACHQIHLAAAQFRRPVGLVLLNGAEAASAMDVGAAGLGPDFAEVGQQLLGHCQIPRLVLTSHGAPVSARLRLSCMSSSQRLVLVSSEDHRCVPNRECHSLPWSLTFPSHCWHTGFGRPPRLVSSDGTSQAQATPPLAQLLRWAAGGEERELRLPDFPGPPRFAKLSVELAEGGAYREVPKIPPVGGALREPGSRDEDVYDILFDAQAERLQVVLKHVQSGQQMPLSQILANEGQYATRRLRFFRYYTDRCSQLDSEKQWAQHMIHELLAMNKNLGNFLCIGQMTPRAPHFGTDLLELILEVELGHLGSAYFGFSRGVLDAEHRLEGNYSILGDYLDDFLSDEAQRLRCQRLQEFQETDAERLRQFQEAENQYFQSHRVKNVDGYVRRELTIDHNIPITEVNQALQQASRGLCRLDDFGHGTNFRFFVEGRAWISCGCESQDFEFVESLVQSRQISWQEAWGRYQELPPWMLPPSFMERNGYRVVAYRKLGATIPEKIHLPDFGPCELKSRIFGRLEELPREIGRGGTTGRLYLYDLLRGQGACYEAVQVNRASWWELQLYSLELDDSAETQEDLLLMLLRSIFEQELAMAKNLWLEGLKKDGLRRSARAFPEDRELREVLEANVALQRRKAENSFSMRPTNAKRAFATGNLSIECKEDICCELLAFPVLETCTALLKKSQVVARMNCGLRSYFPAVVLSSLKIRAVQALRTPAGDPQLQPFRERLALRLEGQDTFSDLQVEVNAILHAMTS